MPTERDSYAHADAVRKLIDREKAHAPLVKAHGGLLAMSAAAARKPAQDTEEGG
jgi:hypothetical protein